MNRHRLQHRRKQRGFLMIDAVGGLLLMLATLTLLAGVTTRAHIVSNRLANERAAGRLAEMTLLRLSANPQAAPDDNVAVTPLHAEAPSGHRWVKIDADVGGRKASVIGLVPIAVPTAASPTTRDDP